VNTRLTFDGSRDVAKMVEKRHDNLLTDIRGYVEHMENFTDLNFQVSEFFQESSYVDQTGRTLPRFGITRKGCEFIANKLTGQKGTLFTAAYINRFHEMEQGNVQPSTKNKLDRLKIQDKNARVRASQTYLRIAENPALPKEYKNALLSYAAFELSGQEILPLPAVIEKTYTATEIAGEYGVSANMIGKIANANGLKVPEYGIEVWDKSRYSAKQVSSWRYNEKGRQALKALIARED
jgi:Rha family phage regulatory protein